MGYPRALWDQKPGKLRAINVMYADSYNQIMAFMTDNASNNDTLIDSIVALAKSEHIRLNAKWIRLRCMPHTVHLAALKVCGMSFVQIITNPIFS